MKIKAVIFDLDGLILDSESWWLNSIKKTNEVYGYNFPLELAVESIGMRIDLMNKKWKKVMGKDFDIDKFRAYNSYFMKKEAKENGINVKYGFFELIKFLKENKIKTAIASSSLSDRVFLSLESANIDKNVFDIIVTGDMVNNGKPEPDIYIKACDMLKVGTNEVLALEDSDNGIKSATSAGIKTILIPDIKKDKKTIEKLAGYKLDNLSQVINVINILSKN